MASVETSLLRDYIQKIQRGTATQVCGEAQSSGWITDLGSSDPDAGMTLSRLKTSQNSKPTSFSRGSSPIFIAAKILHSGNAEFAKMTVNA